MATNQSRLQNRLLSFLLACLGLHLGAVPEKASACLDKAGQIAALDILRLTPDEQQYAVYFWLGDVPLQQRPRFILTFAGHCNALSRRSAFYFPQLVAQDFSLVRVNYHAYAWTDEVIQRLQKANPYATSKLVLQGGYGWRTEKKTITHRGGAFTVPDDSGRYYPNLAAGDYKVDLQFRSDTTTITLVPARWFIWQTLAQRLRNPGYYDFLNLKDRDDFDRLVGFSRQLADGGNRTDLIDAVRFSGVSSQPRNFLLRSSLDGKSYGTEDSEEAVDEKNPLRIVDRKFFKHEAEEWVGFLANGFFAFFLSKANGERQDVAPPFLSDSSSPTNDKQIHVSLGCLRCHYRQRFHGSGGLIDPVPHFRDLLSRMQLATPDYKRRLEFQELYMRPFQNRIVIDRLVHNEAVINCTGMPADIWALNLTTLFEEYDAGAAIEEAALYLGCDAKQAAELMKIALKRYASETGLLDLEIAILSDGGKMPRLQYHKVYPFLYATWQGIKAHEANAGKVLHLLAPNHSDSGQLKPAVLQPRIPAGVLPPGAGLQQHDRDPAALRDPALHHRLPAPDGGNLRERSLPAERDHHGDGGQRSGRAEFGPGSARGRTGDAAAGSPAGQDGRGHSPSPPIGGRQAGSPPGAGRSPRPGLPPAVHGLPQGGHGAERLPTVRPAGQVLGASRGRGQDHLPDDHGQSQAAYAARIEPRSQGEGPDDRRTDHGQDARPQAGEERGRVLSNGIGLGSAVLTAACLAFIWWRKQ